MENLPEMVLLTDDSGYFSMMEELPVSVI